MKKQTADKLIERLGMSYEMEPLLNSFEDGYSRFESSLFNLLKSLEGTIPRIRRKARTIWRYTGPERWGPNPRCPTIENGWKPEYTWNFHCINTFDEALECFRRQYGLGTEEQTQEQIANSLGIAKRCRDKDFGYSNSIHGRPMVGAEIAFVTEVLKQQHKREIWYGALEGKHRRTTQASQA